MATASQRAANRSNAQHSTGPTSPEGKATCSQNGLKHGLSTGQLIVPSETEEDFNNMLNGLLAAYQPANIAETMLVQDMAKYHWLADRALRMQSHAITWDGPLRPPPSLSVLIRYQTTNERAYHRALAAFLALRKLRLAEIGSASQSAAPPPAKSPNPVPPSPQTKPSPEEIQEQMRLGFFYNSETNKYERLKAQEA